MESNGFHPPGMGHYTQHRRASVAYRAVKRFENVARRMSTPDFSLNEIEQNLEKEIKEDDIVPETLRGEFRQSVQQILKSKKVLLIIVVLNIIDCALVLGELILDIVFIKEMVHDAKALTHKFIGGLVTLLPSVFGNLGTKDIAKAYNTILGASTVVQNNVSILQYNNNTTLLPQSDTVYFTNDEVPVFLAPHHGHSLIENLAHAFHKTSITILGILVLVTLLKVACYGSKILRMRLELFDGIIVIASFILDVTFIKGMMNYPLENAVEILSFLIPWRVIRVANSLVVAVTDQAHLQLKIVYKEKKEVDEKLEFSISNIKYHKNMIDAIRSLCIEEGISKQKIADRLASCAMPEPKKKKTQFGNIRSKFKSIYKSLPSGSFKGKPKISFKETNNDQDDEYDEYDDVDENLPVIPISEFPLTEEDEDTDENANV